jgi:hypothetical protein
MKVEDIFLCAEVNTICEQQRTYYTGEPLESGGTSISGKAAPAIRKLIKQGVFDNKTVLDYGAGKYGRNANFLRENGIEVYAYDPFNGTNVDGWIGVSNKRPNRKFDIGLTSYVLNVVPEHTEDEILLYLSNKTKHQIHITRNKDITVTVKSALQRGDNTITSFFKNEYNSDINPKDIDDEMLNKFVIFGVQTSKGFQRIPELENKGFKLIQSKSQYKVYER